MRKYELTVLIHPDLEMNLTPATDKVKAIIEKNGGVITKEANEGKKRLAYDIKKQSFAVYYFYALELPAEAPEKIASVLNITDEVIRYLLVGEDPRRAKILAKRAAHEQKTAQPDGETKENKEN